MTDRPIIFSAPMVRALLDGRKTQTRRVLKKAAALDALASFSPSFLLLPGNVDLVGYAPGDRLWVREAFSYETLDVDRCGFMAPWYWADGEPESGAFTKPKPSIHMPRWASRLTLHVEAARVQRLQDISDTDAQAEGVYWNADLEGWCTDPEGQNYHGRWPTRAFEKLWDTIHGDGAWDANPWVVAITFRVERANIDADRTAAAVPA